MIREKLVASLGEGGGTPPWVTSSRGDDTRMKFFFAAEFTENTGQTRLEGGEGGSGDETKKFFQEK